MRAFGALEGDILGHRAQLLAHQIKNNLTQKMVRSDRLKLKFNTRNGGPACTLTGFEPIILP